MKHGKLIGLQTDAERLARVAVAAYDAATAPQTAPSGSISLDNADGTRTIIGPQAGSGEGAPSGQAIATHVGDTTPPPVPAGITAWSGDGSLHVMWDGTLSGDVPADFSHISILVDGREVAQLSSAGSVTVGGVEAGATVSVTATSEDDACLADGTPAHNVSAPCAAISVTIRDIMAETKAAADTHESQIDAIQKDIADYKKSATATYATKTEVDEKTGAITKTLTADYTKTANMESAISAAQTAATDAANANTSKVLEKYTSTADMETKIASAQESAIASANSNTSNVIKDYAKVALMKSAIADAQSAAEKAAAESTDSKLADYTKTADLAATDAVKDAKSAGTTAQSQLSAYKTSNDAAVADAKSAGTTAQSQLSAYKTSNDKAVAAAKKSGDDAAAALADYKGVVTETFAEKTELTEAVNQLSSTMTSNYTAFTDYRKTNDTALSKAQTDATNAQSTIDSYKSSNDKAVADAKAAGTTAQNQLSAYKGTNDQAVADAKKAGTDAQSQLGSYKTATDQRLDELKNIADNAIESWYLKGAPSTSNAPAKDWTTDALKRQHAGDLYMDTETGYSYRWSGTAWVQVKDSDVTKALKEIQSVKTTYATKSELTATDTELSGKVSDALTTAKSYTDSSVEQEVTARNAAIKAQADSISLSVSKTYTKSETFSAYQTDADGRIATANSNASTAVSTAQTAASDAATAKTNASTAVSTANSASASAANAVKTANAASSSAESAVETANSASSTASAASTTASKASTDAAAAVKTANTASSNASSAVKTANGAVTTANAASSTANAAKTTAEGAASTASSAKSVADSASSTANAASTNASNAVSTANSAKSTAASASSTANAAKSTVDGMKLGGRNLLKGTSMDSKAVTTPTTANTTWGSGFAFPSDVAHQAVIPYGAEYRCSVDVLLPVDGRIVVDMNTHAKSGTDWTGNDNDNTSKRTSNTFNVKANVWTRLSWGSENTSDANTGKQTIYVNDSVGLLPQSAAVTWHYRGLKVELGNKATDWTPAPEDTDSAVADAKKAGTDAQSSANAAKTAASNAQTSANNAQKAADKAQGTADDAWARTLRVQVSSAPADAAGDTSRLAATVWRGGELLSDEAVAKMGLLAWYVGGKRVATGSTYTCAAGTATECRLEA